MKVINRIFMMVAGFCAGGSIALGISNESLSIFMLGLGMTCTHLGVKYECEK